MAKLPYIEFSRNERIPIIYEDRALLAVDKPRGWMLVPLTWQRTNRNLQAAIMSSIAEGHFWATCRNLKFLRHVHRLDSETTGVLLFAKSQGALDRLSDMFESRQMEKRYLAVVDGIPKEQEWTCRLSLSPDPDVNGRIIATPEGKTCETHFRVLQTQPAPKGRTLIEARPVTGRTHQIRVHLAENGLSIVGDPLYGSRANDSAVFVNPKWDYPMGLRAISLSFHHPFLHRPTRIEAPTDPFLKQFGFTPVGEANPGGRVLNHPINPK